MAEGGETGNQRLLHPAMLDRLPRLKTRLGLAKQGAILGVIDRLPIASMRSRVLRGSLQRIIGPVLWSVKIEINNACDLSCRMCYAKKGDNLLPMDDIVRLLDDVAGTGTRVEILGGEPLMRHDLAEIIRYAKQKAHIPQLILYTNARYAGPSRARELTQAGLDVAIVNLISSNEEEHDLFVGKKGAWTETIAGIKCMMAAGVTVYTFTAIHSVNIARVREIHAFVKGTLGAHALFYQYIPQRIDDPLIPDRKSWAEIKNWILCEANSEHARFVRNFCTLAGTSCSGGGFVFTVKVDGTVTPCPFISDVRLGNIKEDSIWKIIRDRFENDRFIEFRSLPNGCRSCTYANVCNGGCKAGNVTLFGHYDHKDSRCLGPWRDPLAENELCDRLPSFF
ncbi:MAG: radical SAM protein [Candidatus Bipolaricaulota bacterium]|nr:radical SAM protein [Candidatus Bipolaricaulota bacterium]